MREDPVPAGANRVDDQIGHRTRLHAFVDRPAEVVEADLLAGIANRGLAERVGPVAFGVSDTGLHPAGAQAADTDRQLGRLHAGVETLGQRDDGVLRGVVRGREPRVQAGHGCGVDDVAAAGHREVRQERADTVDDAPEVDADDPLPRLDRAEPGIAGPADPGVVAHDVNRTEPLHGRRGERLDLVGLADIGHDREHIDTVGADLDGRCGEGVLLHIGEHDRTARGRKRIRERQPDPAATARDDGHLAWSEFHPLPPWS